MHNSHTHCQVAPADPKAKTWQRVCLPPRTTKTTDNQADEEKHRTDNTGLAKVAVQCTADTFVVNQTLVLRINICGENRHLRQARKRCVPLQTKVQTINKWDYFQRH